MGADRYPKEDLLVEPEWLAQHLDDKGVRILDMRNPMNYMAGHIPNGSLVYYEQITQLRAGNPGAVAEPAAIEKVFSELGIDNEKTVVIYGDPGTPTGCRLFWTLEYYGHRKVKLLHGDFGKWVSLRLPVTRDSVKAEASHFEAKPDESKIVDSKYILQNLRKESPKVLDNRSPEEHSGMARVGRRAGRIPGSVNLPWQMCAAMGAVFRPPDQLEQVFNGKGLKKDEELICYCFVGERSAHTYAALRLMGYEKVRLYDRSFMEWGNNLELPIEP